MTPLTRNPAETKLPVQVEVIDAGITHSFITSREQSEIVCYISQSTNEQNAVDGNRILLRSPLVSPDHLVITCVAGTVTRYH